MAAHSLEAAKVNLLHRGLRSAGNLLAGCLEHPGLFDLQQRLFARQYRGLKRAFDPWLAGRGSVLDIGCGTGACAASLVGFDTVSYLGIEAERRYVEYARRQYPRAEFLCADASRVELSPRSFDVVLLFSILHHLTPREAGRVVDGVARVLKPDGVVLSAEPLLPDPGRYRGRARLRALVSLVLLRMDRGDYIRDRQGYLSLWAGFRVTATRDFRSGLHDFCGLVLMAER